MNGFSDVRLVLKTQELQAEQRVKHAAVPQGFTRWQWLWHCLRSRRQLQQLSPEQLRDIGISAEQAQREALKSFWQR